MYSKLHFAECPFYLETCSTSIYMSENIPTFLMYSIAIQFISETSNINKGKLYSQF